MPILINGTTGLSGVDGSAATPSLVGGDSNTGIFFSAADTIDFSEGGVAVGQFDSSANFKFNSGYGSVATAYGCRAWVNFNGTGTPAIRASGNVTSITDNGTGDYTVNFTTAMSDANYSVSGTSGYYATPSGRGSIWLEVVAASTVLTSSVRVQTTSSGSLFDCAYVAVLIHR
jgi:hypothetical protein